MTNLMSKAREIHNEAALKFNPERLSDFIKFVDGLPLVDKDRLIESTQDDALFCAVLNNIFRWDYTTDFKAMTIFFEVGERIIYAGVYDENERRRITRVPIATVKGSDLSAPYTYPEETFAEIQKKLTEAS